MSRHAHCHVEVSCLIDMKGVLKVRHMPCHVEFWSLAI